VVKSVRYSIYPSCSRQLPTRLYQHQQSTPTSAQMDPIIFVIHRYVRFDYIRANSWSSVLGPLLRKNKISKLASSNCTWLRYLQVAKEQVSPARLLILRLEPCHSTLFYHIPNQANRYAHSSLFCSFSSSSSSSAVTLSCF
jgi:hypothetical protein